MKISVKGRYAICSMIYLASIEDRNISVLEISQSLGISKIYLEQVFTILKRAKLVTSSKGQSGGYTLGKNKNEITAYDILYAVENNLFEKPESTTTSQNYEKALSEIDQHLSNAITFALKNITLKSLLDSTSKIDDMFYI